MKIFFLFRVVMKSRSSADISWTASPCKASLLYEARLGPKPVVMQETALNPCWPISVNAEPVGSMSTDENVHQACMAALQDSLPDAEFEIKNRSCKSVAALLEFDAPNLDSANDTLRSMLEPVPA